MGFYRMIDRSLWGDERIQECSPIAKAIFVYLTANEHDDVSGVYRLSIGMINEDTGWVDDDIRSALGELAAQDLAHYDEKRRVVWVVNMFRKQAQSTRGAISKSLLEHACRQIESLPRTPLKAMMIAYYRDAHSIDLPVDLRSEERVPSQTRVPTPPQQGCPGVGGTGGYPPVSVSVSDTVSVSEGGAGGDESALPAVDKSPHPSKPASRKRRSTDPDEGDMPGLVDEVLGVMRQAVQDVTRGRDRGPRDSPGNRDLIRQCTRREAASLDDWRRVIESQANSVRGSPDTWRYLALSTICRRPNWLRLLDAPKARGSPRGPIDPSTQDHQAEVPF